MARARTKARPLVLPASRCLTWPLLAGRPGFDRGSPAGQVIAVLECLNIYIRLWRKFKLAMSAGIVMAIAVF